MYNPMKLVLGVLMSVAMVSESWAIGASGFSTQMVGSRALGQGNAFVAEADDPSAVYFNPAGMTQLEGSQVSFGSALLVPFVDRTGANAPDDKMKRELFALPNAYATHRLEEGLPLAFGVGMTSPFGLTTNWAPTSSVRYLTTESSFQMLQINPSIAYEVMPSLSLGVGADYVNVVKIVSANMLDQSAVGGSDATARLSGHGSGWGYNAGVLWKPAKRHSIGVSYRSQIKVPIKGSLDITGLDPTIQALFNFNAANYSTEARTSFVVPASFLCGYTFKATDAWTLLADYEWTQWNTFDNQDVALSQESDPARLGLLATGPGNNIIRTPRGWRNVSSFALGTNYKLDEAWEIRGGYAFFQRTVPEETFSPDIADSASHLFSTGFSRHWSQIALDAAVGAYVYANRTIAGSVRGASASGTYKSIIPVTSFNLTYKFGK